MPEPADSDHYYTLAAYRRRNEPQVTAAMEDYLEMICRSTKKNGYARIGTLASQLGVKPSSASRMVSNLREAGLVEFEKYAIVTPSPRGWELGGYLLYRHEVLLRFFRALNRDGDQLEQVERVEHFLSEQSVRGLERLLPLMEQK